ncbi:hypothetical protein LTR36_001094 [Oleoguttula mirabilis]|uniref:proline--tRNA ligase n=1 Tax=Oleoguttula mirabilis TaxID=1507867 RepID=A0AAV9JSE2_9PEZI|nr:hypothetical protein LTR36_001094 [Oleoguttula mirabilis]
MLYSNGLRRSFGALHSHSLYASASTRRALHYDGRNRLSNFWTPTQVKNRSQSGDEDGHDLLMRAGFLRQAHSGIFHLLPLGLRVQNKIECLIDKHMLMLGASKVSLSSLSSEELWQRSGRLEGRGSEFFRLQDRKEAKYLLSPTHEEEITTIVANAVHSYKDLPLRLYQVTRKYRDEARPRQGLLRGREFLMKDLYTFDVTDEQARQTYEAVRNAYAAFLDELKLPYLVANADSGNMGGKLSHEYHFASDKGEDIVIGCNSCDYSINEELYVGCRLARDGERSMEAQMYYAVSKDRKKLLQVLYPRDLDLNSYAIKALFPDVDPSVEDALSTWVDAAQAHDSCGTRVLLADSRVVGVSRAHDSPSAVPIEVKDGLCPIQISTEILEPKLEGRQVLLTKAQKGDPCPNCANGHLSLQKAVEIGHTFHLGTRYSEPLDLQVLDANNKQATVSMGCHGIGISRLIGAAAALLADKKGLNWPLAIAPFGTMLVSTSGVSLDDVHAMYDVLSDAGVDAAIDDRERPMGWKLNDADLVGYPFIVVLGKAWAEKRAVELQCRRLGVKEQVGGQELVGKMAEYSMRL